MAGQGKESPEKRYNHYQLIVSISEFIAGLAFLLIIVITGLTVELESLIREVVSNDYLVLILFSLTLGIVGSVLVFPLSFTSGYFLEHKFNLSNQGFGGWLWEKAKGLIVSFPIALVLLIVFYSVIRGFPSFWWFIMGTVLLFFSIVLSRLAPILIFPIFYKFEELKDEGLSERVVELCESVGMKVEGVFQFDLSKTTKKANAAFTGIGKSRRVILTDTLLEMLLPEEILAVLSHELGHFKLKHIWKLMGFSVIVTYAGLFLVSVLYNSTYSAFGFEKISQVSALPLIALFLSLYSFVTSPILNTYSRGCERVADDFATGLMEESETLISGLNKLADQNLADRTPHPLVEFLFYSHPSIEKRISRLKVKAKT